MKKILLSVLALVSIVACTSEDADVSNTNFNYIPSTLTTTWKYDVTTGTNVNQDQLEVTTENGNSFELTASPVPASGFMSGVLSSGTLTKQDGQLVINGVLGFNFPGVGDYTIDLTDAVIYDQNANSGSMIYETTGTFSQTIQGIDLDINYTVSNFQKADVASVTVPLGTYNDVLNSELIVKLSITTEITILGIAQTITLLAPQDVIVVDNFWAREIGLIKSDNQLEYELADFSGLGINLPLPQSANILTVQECTSAIIN
jgi:uncharacterized lipoprotein YehR (DUF1307 family)